MGAVNSPSFQLPPLAHSGYVYPTSLKGFWPKRATTIAACKSCAQFLQELWRPFRIFVLATGHIGVLGRGGIFIFAAVLFFRTVHSETVTGRSAFGNALAQLQGTRGGQAALFIMGLFTCIYGLFCVLSIYARIFPTPPPVSCAVQSTIDPCSDRGPFMPPQLAKHTSAASVHIPSVTVPSQAIQGL